MQRQITTIRPSQPTTDGGGVAIQRLALVGDPSTDPVLLIDELKSPYREDFAAGFPPHPHRGMQTLTYMKHGGIIHEDSLGNRGAITDGGAQWMSAGRGVIHSEMPTQETEGMHGFQLWFNLPAAEKMDPPRYRDIPRAELTEHQFAGVRGIAIAGEWHLDDHSLVGPLEELTPQASLLDLRLDAEAQVTVAVAEAEALVAYVFGGAILRGGQAVLRGHMVIATGGDRWTVTAGSEGAELLVIRGKPLREPVVGYGPFVMNTREEIEQAIRDYQAGRFARA